MKAKKKPLRKKRRQPDILFRRRLATIYARVIILVKISLLIGSYLWFFSHQFDFIKTKILQNTYQLTAALGFRLENILIEGQQNVASESILSALESSTGTPIMAINLSKIQARLQQNPWIKAAAVERRIPSTIYITILERSPIAIWQVNQKFLLIDPEGHHIAGADLEKFSDLLHVVGPDANIYADQLIKACSRYPELATKIISAVRYGERRWNLNLQQNISIKMPEIGFNQALDYLAGLNKINKLFDQNYKSLDLRDASKYYTEKY